MRTAQQHAGDEAEELVARSLTRAGWRILARNLRLGRQELDLVALDPGPPPEVVIIEVRWRADRAFGLPEETVDWRKRRQLRRARAQLLDSALPDLPVPRDLPVRVDLVVVEPPLAGTMPRLRHHRHALGG